MKYDHLIGSGFSRWSSGKYTHGQLQAFLDYENSFILMSGAYRSGKSELGSRALIRHAYYFPGAKVGIFRNFLASLKKSTLPNVLELIHPSWVADWSNTDLVLRLKNGSIISFIGCDFPDRLGSIELTGSFIDEASEVTAEALGMIQGRLSGSLNLPSNYSQLPVDIQQYLTETKELRQMFLATNPKSKGHHLYQDYIKEPKPGHVSYTSNSISNVNLPEIYLVNNLQAYVKPGHDRNWIIEQIHLIRSGQRPSDGLHLAPYLTPFGQRNLLGLWVDMEGAIYALDESLHYIPELPKDNPSDYIIGLDWGFNNPRVSLLAVYGNNVKTYRYVMVDGWSRSGTTPDEMINSVCNFCDSYDVSKVYAPPDQPGLIKTLKQTLGSSKIRKAKNAVLPGINSVSRMLSENRLSILQKNKDTELAYQELSGYQWKTDRDGTVKDEPLKEADHYPDAIRYAIYSRHYKDSLGIDEDEDEGY